MQFNIFSCITSSWFWWLQDYTYVLVARDTFNHQLGRRNWLCDTIQLWEYICHKEVYWSIQGWKWLWTRPYFWPICTYLSTLYFLRELFSITRWSFFHSLSFYFLSSLSLKMLQQFLWSWLFLSLHVLCFQRSLHIKYIIFDVGFLFKAEIDNSCFSLYYNMYGLRMHLIRFIYVWWDNLSCVTCREIYISYSASN